MFARRAFVLCAPLLFVLAACDEPASTKAAPSAQAATTTPAPSAAPTPAPTPSVAVKPKIEMPPRPMPIGSSGPVQPSAPPDMQMMAIQYTIAMVTPRNTDPAIVDKEYVDRISKKLEAAVRTADKGKTPPNPVQATKGNRKIEINMGHGCTEKVPENLLQGRSGSSLKEAYEAGVLVISCHDDKWECHQSTRIPEDILCHAAPRH